MDLENQCYFRWCLLMILLPKFRSPFAPKQGNFFKATRKTNFNFKVLRKFYSFQVRMAALTGLSLLRLASRGSRLMVNSRATISSTPGKLLSQSHSRFEIRLKPNVKLKLLKERLLKFFILRLLSPRQQSIDSDSSWRIKEKKPQNRC